MHLLTIDPGVRTIGAALSEGGIVTKADTFTVDIKTDDPIQLGALLAQQVLTAWGMVDVVWVERPIHRVRSKKPIRIKDLLDMSVVVGCFSVFVSPSQVHSLTPKQWKGDLPKATHHQRITDFLASLVSLYDPDFEEEKRLWESLQKKSDHNARDAFALNLYALGRINRGAE